MKSIRISDHKGFFHVGEGMELCVTFLDEDHKWVRFLTLAAGHGSRAAGQQLEPGQA